MCEIIEKKRDDYVYLALKSKLHVDKGQ